MKRFALFCLALFFAPGMIWAAETPPEGMLMDITFYHGLSEYKLPLSKNPDFFVRTNLPTVPENQELMGENAVCRLGEEKSGNGDVSVETKQDQKWGLDEEKLLDFFIEYIEPKVNHDMQSVRIFRDEEGNIQFDGEAAYGEYLNREQAVVFVKKAVEEGVSRVELPMKEIHPVITVEDEELKNMGIKDLVSVGESDFSGSTWARMQNIEVGSNKYNGFLIPQGEVASFNDQLGEVGPEQGYVKELVILGPKVDKEFGGGLCQVSSTAFRAALLAGLPIVERYPHSFAVHYYEPWGTDATIYPGSKDLKFENNTDGALLMQTVMNRETKKLRFLYYGTKDNRKVKMFGPQIAKNTPPLAPKHETSTKLAPGEVQRLSAAVPGFDASWVRVVIPDPLKSVVSKTDEENPDSSLFYSFFSRYTPRGDWTVTGVAPGADVPEESTI